jgi:hypothetical protein
MPVEGILDRPAIFKALFVTLFSKSANLNHQYVNIRHPQFSKNSSHTGSKGVVIDEYMIDSKPQAIRELKDISVIAIHPRLPIVVVCENTEIVFLSIKSMACLTHFSLPSNKAIKNIIFDETSYKFFVIDVQNVAYIYKFGLDFEQMDLINTITGHKIYHGTFYRNSTAIIFTTYTSFCAVFDLITSKITKIDLYDLSLVKNRVEYIRDLDRVLFVNKRRGLLISGDSQEISHRQTSELHLDQISCYTISKDIIIIGYNSGVIKIVSLKDFSLLFEQSFDESEAKKIKVEDIIVLKGFIIAALSNGIVSIVNKI